MMPHDMMDRSRLDALIDAVPEVDLMVAQLQNAAPGRKR